MSVCEVWEPRAFGGGVLRGDRVAKFAHMDESGISKGEPHCVQAAVIIDADTQWKAIELELAKLVHELVPREFRGGYVFHAKDVFHGNDPAFSRERLPNPADRAAVVCRFASVTKKFWLPIVFGHVDRQYLGDELGERAMGPADIHAFAYLRCVAAVDEWVRDNTERDVAMLIVENNNESRRLIKAVHNVLKLPVDARPVKFEHIPPFERIVEQPSFQDKEPLSALQIADACAFSITRCLRKAAHWETLYEGIRHGVTSWPAAWAEQCAP